MKINSNIDINNLDEEIRTLPNSYEEFSKEADEIETKVKQLKLLLEYRSALLEKEHRSESKKTTEGEIKNVIAINDKINELKKQILEEEKKLRVLKSAIKVLELKHSSLKQLVTLYTTGYFQVKNNNEEINVKQKIYNKLNNN